MVYYMKKGHEHTKNPKILDLVQTGSGYQVQILRKRGGKIGLKNFRTLKDAKHYASKIKHKADAVSSEYKYLTYRKKSRTTRRPRNTMDMLNYL